METRRSLGEDCLKDSDCLSGTCAQLVCAAAPPTTDTPPVAEAGSGGAADDAPGPGAGDASAAADGEGGAAGDARSGQEDVVETREGAASDGTMDSDGSGD